MANQLGRAVIFVAVLLCTAGFDQGTKELARDNLTMGAREPVIAGFWDWQLASNDGAAFSSFRGAQVVLSLLAGGVLVALGVAAARTRPEQRMKRVALAVIAGGAVGNLVDRVRDGAVTDFVRWQIAGHDWPIFNVADVALVLGVGLLMLDGFLERTATER